MMRSRIAWIDFYDSQKPTPIDKQTYTSKLSVSSVSVHVSNCLFKSIASTGSGGALSCSDSVQYFLVESSSFFTCTANSGYGGAIYFSNTMNGQSVLHEVCGNDCCSTTANCQFVYTYVKDTSSSKNYANYSSIARCVNDNVNSWSTFYINYGKNCCPSVNVSMNKCGFGSGVYCYPYPDSNYVTCSFTYSSFADNNATLNNCIYFDRNNAQYEIKYCNIIRNIENSGNGGTIRVDGNMLIEGSCILENRASYNFRADSTSYTLTLSNCTVDKTTSYQKLVMQNTITKSFILGLNHMSTQNCNVGYDSVGYLTAVPYVSQPTKKISCYTHNGNNDRIRIGDFFSLNCVFMVTFIHPHPSGDC
jgi:hypothetical protein